MEIKDLLGKYISGYKILTTQLDQIPAKVIHFKPQKNKWSIAEIIVHLADSEAHGFVRAKKIIAECGGKVCVYNQQIWAERLFYEQMDYKDALEMIRIIRKSLYKVLTLIPEESWHNYIYHPETGKITLLDWIQLYTGHIDVHVQQMHRNYYDWKKQSEKELSKSL